MTQWNNEGNISSSKAGGQARRITNPDAGVDVLLSLENLLVTSCRRGVLEVNVAAIAGHSRIETLENEIDLESELISVKSERARNVPHSEDRRDVAETLGSFVHKKGWQRRTVKMVNRSCVLSAALTRMGRIKPHSAVLILLSDPVFQKSPIVRIGSINTDLAGTMRG